MFELAIITINYLSKIMKNINKIIKISLYLIICININNLFFRKSLFRKPKISIFLTIYNKGLYLKDCIQSLQKQTLKNIEIVAVNDGSTDNSLKILKKLSKTDRRIKILNNDRNHGSLYSRAMGIMNSSGEYLMNLDGDDRLIHKNDLEVLYKTSKANKYDVLIYLIKRIANNKTEEDYFQYLNKNQLKIFDDHITNKIVKRDLFIKSYHELKKEIFSNNWCFHEDNLWSYLVRKNAQSIGVINKYMYYYKRNKDSLNMKMGNELDAIQRFYRHKKLKDFNYINISNYSVFSIIRDIDKYKYFLNNRELKNLIIRLLIDIHRIYTTKITNIKLINNVLNNITHI